jgi:hypothetical protein
MRHWLHLACISRRPRSNFVHENIPPDNVDERGLRGGGLCGYPHGEDQFISITAAGWATTALALALPATR